MKEKKIQNVQKALLYWYSGAKRNLPWRQKINFYRVWVSEIILQQTKVKQGMVYFERFIEKFPDYYSLANATEKEVLKLWQGLGYYSRAINMHKAANQIITEFKGRPPQTFSDIKKLKGVGNYTAAAISSIVFNEPHAVVDGNVFRVLSRFLADKIPITTGKGKKHFTNIANTFLDKNNPGEFNQAMMELGALICKPKNPLCSDCPIEKWCQGKSNWQNFPVKQGKIIKRIRYFNYFIIEENNNILMYQRNSDDIYKNMYELPLIETTHSVKNTLNLLQKIKERWKIKDTSLSLLSDYRKHILTHQTIFYCVYFLSTSSNEFKKISEKYFFPISIGNIKDYPVSNIVKNILLEHKGDFY